MSRSGFVRICRAPSSRSCGIPTPRRHATLPGDVRHGNQRAAAAPARQSAARAIDASARPADVVPWLGAVQSQDFAGGEVGAQPARARRRREADVERAFDDGEILRTHVLRPTWHFVHRDDLPLDARAVGPARRRDRARATTGRWRSTRRCSGGARRAIERALEGGRSLTRAELAAALAPRRASRPTAIASRVRRDAGRADAA